MLKINIKTGGAAYSDDDVLTTEGRYELQKKSSKYWKTDC